MAPRVRTGMGADGLSPSTTRRDFLAVAGLGLSLIFGVLKLVNFAHAQFLLIGAYVALYFNSTLGWSIWLAMLPAFVVGSALGVASDAVIWKPLRRRGVSGPTLPTRITPMERRLWYRFISSQTWKPNIFGSAASMIAVQGRVR